MTAPHPDCEMPCCVRQRAHSGNSDPGYCSFCGRRFNGLSQPVYIFGNGYEIRGVAHKSCFTKADYRAVKIPAVGERVGQFLRWLWDQPADTVNTISSAVRSLAWHAETDRGFRGPTFNQMLRLYIDKGIDGAVIVQQYDELIARFDREVASSPEPGAQP